MTKIKRFFWLLSVGSLTLTSLKASDDKSEKIEKEKVQEELSIGGKEWREQRTTQRIENILKSLKAPGTLLGSIVAITKKDISHYRYLNAEAVYATDSETNTKESSDKNFINSFRASARRGAELFWNDILPAGGEQQPKAKAKDLDAIIDLVNFILFSASTEQLKLTNLGFFIYSSDEITRRFIDFFKSAPRGKNKEEEAKFFQKDNGWFSVHLHRAEKDFRDHWPAQDMYKSFAFYTSIQTPRYFELYPHSDQAAKPSDPGKENVIELSIYNLLEGYLMFAQEDEQTKVANLMSAAAQSAATKNPSDEARQKIDEWAEELLKDVKKKEVSKEALYLAPYIEQMVFEYHNLLTRVSLQGDIIINPSLTQLTDSLKQYTTKKVTASDCEAFLEHATHGAKVFRALMENKKFATQIATSTEMEDEDNPQATNRALFKEYMRAIIDVNLFCYLLGIYLRDDGIGSAAFVAGIVGVPQIHDGLLLSFLNFLKDKGGLSLGTTKDLHAANYYGYYRSQTHDFTKAFGIDVHVKPEKDLFSKNYVPSKPIPRTQPLLFPLDWDNPKRYGTGAQFHLLIGDEPNVPKKFYSKWEDAGLNSGGITDPGEWLVHAKGAIQSKARKLTIIRSCFGMLSDDEPQFNKERVPAIIDEYIKASIIEKNRDQAKKAAKAGIFKLYEECKALKDGEELKAQLEKTYDHPDLRKGREIIIAPDRDDSIVWIDYFTTENVGHKKLYEDFSRIKHQIIDLATGRAQEQKPQKTIEKEGAEEGFITVEYEESPFKKTFELYKEFSDQYGKLKKDLPSHVEKYLSNINTILEKLQNLSTEKQSSFVRQNARIMFDLHFYKTVAKELNRWAKEK